MTAAIPVATNSDHENEKPITMFGPDFPFAYDNYLNSPYGLGEIPESRHGEEVAIMGVGLSGMISAYELMRMGLKPVIYEVERIGGRLRTETFDGYEQVKVEMGAMRFPPSSTAFFHYVDKCKLTTKPFPNPFSQVTPSTVVDLKGVKHYAEQVEDLPPVFNQVSQAWYKTLSEKTSFEQMQKAIRERDVGCIKRIWDPLVKTWDDRTFYGFLAESEHFKSFKHREIFGQVGFGTGGWDTDFPNSMLEILRVVYTGADDDHQTIVKGTEALPVGLWQHSPSTMKHWPDGTTLESLNEGSTRPGVTHIYKTKPNKITIVDSAKSTRTYSSVVITPQSWMLLNNIQCDETLFDPQIWTAIERTHYMQASKIFVCVDEPFWKEKNNNGQDILSMTLSDRMTRGTYLLEGSDHGPSAICLSYTWTDDSIKLLGLDEHERTELMLSSLAKIYPDVDIRSHIISDPVTISWETEQYFMGAFKANLPGHYRYQRRLYTHFMQQKMKSEHQGVFLAGDDISWTAGWAEGAVTTAINAVWGVMNHLGGKSLPANPGPGDRFDQLAPVKLPEN